MKNTTRKGKAKALPTITTTELYRNYKYVIAIPKGICDDLFCKVKPNYTLPSDYGWSCDVYTLPFYNWDSNIAITVGEMPFGNAYPTKTACLEAEYCAQILAKENAEPYQFGLVLNQLITETLNQGYLDEWYPVEDSAKETKETEGVA